MFGGKWTHVKSNQVVISKEEYERLKRDSESLKRVYSKIVKSIRKRRQRDVE